MRTSITLSAGLIMVIALCSLTYRSGGSSGDKQNSTPTLFQSNELLELTIRFPHRKLIRDVGEEREYHDAMVFFTSGDSIPDSLNVRIRTRGHFRRDPMNCDFPPLLLNFKKNATYSTLFEGIDKVKLVIPCKAGRDSYEQYVLKEYLVYRLYNFFTEESFRVRLVRINFIDQTGKKEPLLKFGFLIEPKEYLRARTDSETITIKNVSQKATKQEKMLTLCIFQYMIGNTDWSLPVLHNIVLLRSDPGEGNHNSWDPS